MDWEAINAEVVAFGKAIAAAPQGPPVVISDSKDDVALRIDGVRAALVLNRHYAALFADLGDYKRAARIMFMVSEVWSLTLR